MSNDAQLNIPQSSFDLFRISHSKREVDLAPNTIRKLSRENGLRIYWVGSAAFVSKTELQTIIRVTSAAKPPKRRSKV
jgi:hypothetical protein